MSGRFKGVAVASLVTVLAFCVSGCLDGCSSSQEVNSGLNAQEQAAKSDEVASSDASEDVEVSQDTSELNGADELVGIWDDGYNEVMFDGKLAYLGDGEIPSLYTVRAVEGNSITLSFDESGGELSFEFDDPDTLIGENGSDKPAKGSLTIPTTKCLGGLFFHLARTILGMTWLFRLNLSNGRKVSRFAAESTITP